jgi:head-tail adaptor
VSLAAGALTERIRIERQAAGRDGYGGKTGDWETIAEVRAQVSYGTGMERREAAQESASAPATFRIRRGGLAGGVTAKDRLRFEPFAAPTAASPIWDISSAVPFGRDAIDITATRKA